MTNKLTLAEQEELFAKDCKLINLKYEYNGYTGDEKWAIITELSVKELWEKYPLVIERYSPFVHLSIAQGEVIDDANRNEDKYAVVRQIKRGLILQIKTDFFNRLAMV